MSSGESKGRGAFLATVVVILAAILFAGSRTAAVWDDSVLRDLAQNYRDRVFQIREETFVAENATMENSPNAPLDGIVILVTGSTSGLGHSLVRWAFREGATIVAMGRSKSKLEMLRDELVELQQSIDDTRELGFPEGSKQAASNGSHGRFLDVEDKDKESSPRRFFPIVADMSDLTSVSTAVDDIMNTLSSEMVRQIDIVICNAGIWQSSDAAASFTSSKQGHELTFGVNYLSHFLLTEKLMHTRIADSDQYIVSPKTSRVVQVTSTFNVGVAGTSLSVVAKEESNAPNNEGDTVDVSMGHSSPAPLASRAQSDRISVHDGFLLRFLKKHFRSQRQYSNSKLAQLLQARISNRKFFAYCQNQEKDSNNRVYLPFVSACPGWVGTKILRSKIEQDSWRERFFYTITFDADGYGLSSILKAMFDPLLIDLIDSKSTYDDSPIENFDYFPNFGGFLTLSIYIGDHAFVFLESISREIFGTHYMNDVIKYGRDVIATSGCALLLVIQRFFKTLDVIVRNNDPSKIPPKLYRYKSSIASYNRTLQHELYEWSLETIAEYL